MTFFKIRRRESNFQSEKGGGGSNSRLHFQISFNWTLIVWSNDFDLENPLIGEYKVKEDSSRYIF